MIGTTADVVKFISACLDVVVSVHLMPKRGTSDELCDVTRDSWRLALPLDGKRAANYYIISNPSGIEVRIFLVKQVNTITADVLGPLLLTWLNFNPSMDK